MLCSSLNAAGLLTYSSLFFFNVFSLINMILVHINISFFVVEISARKSCDKRDFHPSRDASLLYVPLDGLYGPWPSVYTIF